MKFDINTLRAAELYLHRNKDFGRPEGEWKRNGFYPTGRDWEVLADVRVPTRAFPNSYRNACNSLAHCARYHEASDITAVRKATKLGLLELRRMLAHHATN